MSGAKNFGNFENFSCNLERAVVYCVILTIILWVFDYARYTNSALRWRRFNESVIQKCFAFEVV